MSRGMRLVSRKLRSSWCGDPGEQGRAARRRHRDVIQLPYAWRRRIALETSTVAYIAAALGVAALARSCNCAWNSRRAKHPSLAGHSRLARRMARPRSPLRIRRAGILPRRRRAGRCRRAAAGGLHAPGSALRASASRDGDAHREVEDEISDLQFTDRYRVPFQFRRLVRKHLKSGSFVAVVRRRAAHRPRRQPAL